MKDQRSSVSVLAQKVVLVVSTSAPATSLWLLLNLVTIVLQSCKQKMLVAEWHQQPLHVVLA
jgi:hypothetical protein